jgi:hypothetical protein
MVVRMLLAVSVFWLGVVAPSSAQLDCFETGTCDRPDLVDSALYYSSYDYDYYYGASQYNYAQLYPYYNRAHGTVSGHGVRLEWNLFEPDRVKRGTKNSMHQSDWLGLGFHAYYSASSFTTIDATMIAGCGASIQVKEGAGARWKVGCIRPLGEILDEMGIFGSFREDLLALLGGKEDKQLKIHGKSN